VALPEGVALEQSDANSAKGTPRSIGLGFASFHFGVRGDPPLRFTGADYIRAVEQSLSASASIENIRIKTEEGFETASYEVGEIPELAEGDPSVPHLDWGGIQFEVRIPERVQEDVSPMNLPVWTGTERFRVTMGYGWALPVTMIEPLDAADDSDPTDAVIVVREFLKREMSRTAAPLVRFECLGPSPVHVRVFLRPASDANSMSRHETFRQIRHRKVGYDTFVFEYDGSRFKDPELAAQHFLREVDSELDIHYRLIHCRVALNRDWLSLRELVDDLIEGERATGFRALLRRTFRSSRQVHEAFVSLAEFESQLLALNQELDGDYRTRYGQGTTSYLQPVVEQRMESRLEYPTEQIGRLLDMFEERRLTDREIAIVGMAAVIGGAVGAALTALLG
jgi:hypothetical protein